jgi:peptide/nickel transport system substrate-binding protein
MTACGAQPAPKAPVKPAAPKILVQAVQASPTAWDLTKADWITWQGVQNLYDTLLFADEKEQIQKALVESWTVSPDGLQYKLTLRKGVKFHDGTPFNAEAVKFNFERHQKADSRYNFVYQKIQSIETIDEHTVNIRLKTLDVNFIFDLAGWGCIQLSPTAFKKLGANFATQPVGTGPFKFKAYEPDSHIDLVRFDEYWGGAPKLDGIRIRIIPEQSVHIVELKAKNVDLSYAIQPKDAKGLQDQGIIVTKNATPGSQFISINVAKGHTAEFAVRRAIAHAIDRDTIIKEVLLGYAEKSRAGVPRASPFYNDDIPMIEHDPKKAAEILDQAGWKLGPDGIRHRAGKPLRLDILSTDFGTYGQMNVIIQEQLKRIGIDSKIRTFEWGAYLDKWRSEADFEITFHSQGSSLHSTAIVPAAWNPSNYWHIHHIRESKDPALMKVSERLEGLNTKILATLSFDERKKMAKEVQQLIQDNQLVVWLWHSQSLTAVQPYVKDYRLVESGRIYRVEKATVEK